MDKITDVLVSYAINRSDQYGEHVTMHNTTIYFEGPAAEDVTISDILNRLIWTIKGENPEIESGNITLINYWII